MILCTGFYHRDNMGDDIFYIMFKNIFDDMKLPYKMISLDDIKTIDSNIEIIVLGGGEILNKYFLSKIQKMTENFTGKIIAYSCELPQGDIIKEVNLIDYFVVRNYNDYQRLLKHFNQQEINPYIEYVPDIVCSYPTKRQLIHTKGKKATVCLARSIFSSNNFYNFYLKKVCLFLKYISQLGWTIDLIPFNTSSNNSESDLLLNEDLVKIANSLGFKLNNINLINQKSIENKLNSVINQFKSSDIIICSRYHAHVLAVVCGKPIFSIPHTKKAKEQIKSFGLDQWVLEPTLDSANRPINFNVPKAIELFNNMITNYNNIYKSVMKLKFSSLDEHKIKLGKLLSLEKRIVPPFYTSDTKCNKIINDIKSSIKETFDLDNFDCDQSQYNDEYRNRITRFILYKLCKDPGAPYFYGLASKILKPNFNLIEDLKWIYNDYYSKNPINLQFISTINNENDKLKILNLKYIEPHLLSNIHRSGWAQVVHNTGVLHNSDGIIFDMFCDKTFHWGETTYLDLQLIPYNKPWIGIIHHTPNELYTDYNTTNMIKKDSWIKSLDNCIGLYTMSDWLSHWFKCQIPDLFVETLIHPTEIPNIKFSFKKFMENSNKKVIQIGGWLRNPYSIYRINVPEYITKCHLIGKDMDNYMKPNVSFENLLENTNTNTNTNKVSISISQDQNSNKYVHFMLEYIKSLDNQDYNSLIDTLKKNQMSVQLISRLENNEYDMLLSNNIVFIDLIEASACNTLIECIVRNTPILVRPQPSIIERLGLNYPMYWNKYSDIEKLLTIDNIKKTHEYLEKLDKTCYTFNNWIDSIINSEIFNKAYSFINPNQNMSIELLNTFNLEKEKLIEDKLKKIDSKSSIIITNDQVLLEKTPNTFIEEINMNILNKIENKNNQCIAYTDIVNSINDTNIVNSIDDINIKSINEVIELIDINKPTKTNNSIKKKSIGKKVYSFLSSCCKENNK